MSNVNKSFISTRGKMSCIESGMGVVSSEMMLLSCGGWEFMVVALARGIELILLQHENHGSKMISIFL